MDKAEIDERLTSSLQQAERLRKAALELLQVANQLELAATSRSEFDASQGSAIQATQQGPETFASDEFLQTASNTYWVRRQREKYFPAAFFGEPAWDILLDLYAGEAKGRVTSVTSACIAASTPLTTGLRWLGVLEGKGFVKREPSNQDNRVMIVRLTAQARSALEAYFAEQIDARTVQNAIRKHGAERD